MSMRVPTYQPQVEREVVQHTPQTADAYGGIAANQTLQVARGLDGMADGFDRIAEQQANTEAFNAEAKAKQDWIAYSAELQKNRQGVNAVGVTKDVEKWWDENKSKYGAGKPGRAGRMIEAAMTRLKTANMEQFKGFELQQGLAAADAAVQANVNASITSIAANPSADNIALQRTGIDAALRTHAASRGWAPEVLNDKVVTAQSAATIAAFNTLFARSPAAARDFWMANRETVRGEQRDEIETRLKHGLAAMEGNEAVDAIWRDMGPKSDMDAVETDKMAAALRDKFKDQPETLKAALQSLNERKTEHNSSQLERAAQYTNEVTAIWNATHSLSTVKRSQAWNKLPSTQQAKIEEHIGNVLWQQEQRALTREQRALTAANRDVVAEQRRQQRLQQQGFARYLELSNPQRLAGMSDAQVQALLPELGNELTEHLVKQRRTLASADAVREAKMDKDDFNEIARQFKLPVDKEYKTEPEKAALGTLHYRVEQLIDAAQRQKKGVLDRQEKQALMRSEMAKQVLVNPGLFSSNLTKPVISLTPEEVAKVQVPAGDRAAIVKTMRLMYERTGSPEFAPNEENLKRFYLLQQSRAADLIPRPADGE